MKTGSPEWFYEKAHTKEKKQLQEEIENLRFSFLKKFSPEKLAAMNGSELLTNVFSFAPGSMMYLLMFDGSKVKKSANLGEINYNWFGGVGTHKDRSPVYYVESSKQWKNNQGNIIVPLRTEKDAEKKAIQVRDSILFCVDAIKECEPIISIDNYRDLNRAFSRVYFSKYTWALKYFQMVFPYYFPGMYADHTIERALHIIGLTNRASKIENVGEISLFIRKCNINNILFNEVYADEWTWGENEKSLPRPCENASENFKLGNSANSVPDMDYYKIPEIKGVLSPQEPKREAHSFAKIPEKLSEDTEYIEDVNAALEEIEEVITYAAEPKAKPEKVKTKEGNKYPRDSKVGAKAIKRAGFSCEINSTHKTFDKKSDGKQYMEAHHIVPMSQQEYFENSLDVEANVVSLCCTCHRNIHLGVGSAGLLKIIYDKRKTELKKAGINISFDDLKNMY